jgi:hypothetical protein
MALYSDKGTMINLSTKSISINASGGTTINMDNAFTLPANISNYIVKVFVWDGSDFSSTTQTPKSNVVQMP